jgi:RNA polymerase sigma-70 factor (ECF subfamily)
MASTDEFEQQALAQLPALLALARRLVRNQAEAEDLVQETLLKAFRAKVQYERGTHLKAWLFKILKNTFINSYRKKQQVPLQSDFAEIEDAFEGRLDDEVRLRSPNPEDVVFETVLDGDVQRALDELPVDYRMAVTLADLEDFSYKEVAEILDIPVGTVMSRLYRGRKALEDAMLAYAKGHGYMRNGAPAKMRSR